jgi:hypothetical protein
VTRCPGLPKKLSYVIMIADSERKAQLLRSVLTRQTGRETRSPEDVFMRNWVTISLIGAAAMIAPTLALAGGSAPQAACAGVAQAYPTSDLDWRDDHTCFTSARACRAWQRDMRIAYRQVEGDRTCLPLR